MYLFGYISFFGNDVAALKQSFELLEISDKEDLYLTMYQALKEKDIETIKELILKNKKLSGNEMKPDFEVDS